MRLMGKLRNIFRVELPQPTPAHERREYQERFVEVRQRLEAVRSETRSHHVVDDLRRNR